MIENWTKEFIIQRLLAITLLVVLFVLCFQVVQFFIVPALWAAILAYVTFPIYNFFYGHEWQLSRTWKLNYGVGWGVRPYDGKDEEKTYAVLGFEGRF